MPILGIAPGICPPQRELCFLSFTVKPRWLPLQQVKSTVSRDGGRGLLFTLPHSSLNTCGWTLSDTLWDKRLLWAVLGKQPSLAFLMEKKKSVLSSEWLTFKHTLGTPVLCESQEWLEGRRTACRRSTLEFQRQHYKLLKGAQPHSTLGNSTSFSQIEIY